MKIQFRRGLMLHLKCYASVASIGTCWFGQKTRGHLDIVLFLFVFCFVFPYAASSGLNSLPRGIRHFQSTIAFKCVCVGGGGEGAVGGGCVRACVGGGEGLGGGWGGVCVEYV